MARLMFSGLDDIANELSHMGETAGALTDQMLRAGAEEVKKGWQMAIDEAGLNESGAMRASVGPSKSIKGDANMKYIEIYPQGTDSSGKHAKNPVRNAEKAFINHYGSSSHAATRFVDRAEEYGEAMAVPVMQKIWDSAK